MAKPPCSLTQSQFAFLLDTKPLYTPKKSNKITEALEDKLFTLMTEQAAKLQKLEKA
jgi:hypothetical protein